MPLRPLLIRRDCYWRATSMARFHRLLTIPRALRCCQPLLRRSAIWCLASASSRSSLAEELRQCDGLERSMSAQRSPVPRSSGNTVWNALMGKRVRCELPPPAGVAAAKRDLVSLLAELAAAGQSVAGVYVEDKQRALGVHTRRCDEPVRAFELLQPLVAEIGVRHDLQVEPGKLVIELRSASLSKADALTELVDEYQPTSVVMIGDDLGDLPAFRLLPELRERGIVSCGVVSASQEQPALLEYADVLCDGPVGVADWLSQLASELG